MTIATVMSVIFFLQVAEPLKPTSMDAYYIVFYVLVVAILSAFLNILTLFLTIPALMCAFMVRN